MMNPAEFLTKHRNGFLLALLVTTLYVSSAYNREQLAESAPTVAIPTMATAQVAQTPLEAYRAQRDSAYLSDKASLEVLCDQKALDRQTREDAAARLALLVDQHQAALNLEGALLESDLSPCVAVVSAGAVTVVSEKSEVSDSDAALVVTLAEVHAGVGPSGVRIITAEK